MEVAWTVHPAWADAPRGVRAAIAVMPAAATAWPVLLVAGRAELFRDELATAQLSSLPVGELWRATDHVDRAMLPYLLLMKGWEGLAGDSTLALRAPSIVAAIAVVSVVSVLAGRLSGPVGGAIAGLMLALAPLSGTLSVLARPYAPAALVAMMALLVLHRALECDGRGFWIAHAALVTASVLLQPFAVVALLAHVALTATTSARPPWRRVAGAWVLAGAVAFPLAAGARDQQGQVGWIAVLGPHGVATMVRDALSGPVAWAAVAGGLVGLVLLAWRVPAPWCWVGMALVVGPPLLLALISVALHPAFVARYLFLMPAGAALLGGGGAGVVADAVARGHLVGGRFGRRTVPAALCAATLVATVVLLPRVDVRPLGGVSTTGPWSADPPSTLAGAVGEVLRPGDHLVVEQRVGWGGYADGLARGWNDGDFAGALDRRAVSGALTDVTRVVTSVGPVRTADPTDVPPGGEPVRVVLLSLRSTAADRFVEAAAAGCVSGPRLRDGRLYDTRLWVLECESVPDRTALSEVADHPSQ